MRRFSIFLLVLLVLAVAWTGCSTGRKSYSEMRGLMLLENTQLGRNRAYYSKHKSKQISAAHRKYQKNRKFKY
jgi:hypothetical protein